MKADKIIDAVCVSMGLKREILNSDTRVQEYTWGRFIAVHLIKQKHDDITWKAIGMEFNRETNSAHCFAIHANKRFKDLMEVDKSFQKKFLKVTQDMQLDPINFTSVSQL